MVSCGFRSVKYLDAESCILLSVIFKSKPLCIFLKPDYKLDPHFKEKLLFLFIKKETRIENRSEADRHMAEAVVGWESNGSIYLVELLCKCWNVPDTSLTL